MFIITKASFSIIEKKKLKVNFFVVRLRFPSKFKQVEINFKKIHRILRVLIICQNLLSEFFELCSSQIDSVAEIDKAEFR